MMNAKIKRLTKRQQKRYLLREAEKVLCNLLMSPTAPSNVQIEAAVSARYNEIFKSA
ncbi:MULTISPECIES: hypothetical protein [Deefgea]|uniref:Uncharacterized protein n=2 Tax=Deefgea TaxID=400947 RepID=A0A6M8ST04_9NEIS|nr:MULTISPECIES: hypothetical protein [Deefgea]MBM5574550.1 hypothetical protein [Deefgea sp. CFH1-16]MCB5196844.1 hypothetical protein [Deefgea salmonis]QKJ66506.1 hypothetical protein HQN60_07230 [Deefgea piscis]